MGYLVTVTMFNDGLGSLVENSEEFCQNLVRIANSDKGGTIPLRLGKYGSHANFAKVHQVRHADDHTLYVHMGNTVCEMRTYSSETEDLMKNHPKFFEDMLKYMEEQAKELREKYEAVKKNSD